MKNKNYEDYKFGSVVNTILPSGYPDEFPLHWHKYIEIAALPEDAVPGETPVICVGGAEYELMPGDVLFIWPGELHETRRNPGGQLAGLQFAPTLLYELPEISMIRNRCRGVHLVSSEQEPEFAQLLQMYINQIFELQRSRPPFFETEKILCMLEMFIGMGKKLESDMNSHTAGVSGLSGDTVERIKEVCTFLADNCEREISLDSAAALAGFSPSYFSRVFKQVTEQNFVEYLSLQRVRAAQALLTEGNMPITEVSSRAGFKSISTFNRVFRQYRGCSPSEYRRYMV